MKTARSNPWRVPGVGAALGWLIDADGNMGEREVLKIARLQGLLLNTAEGEIWKCSGPGLEKLIKKRLRARAKPMSGSVLIGIGELLARSQVRNQDIERDMGRLIFGRSHSEVARAKLFREALEIAASRIVDKEPKSVWIYEKQALSVMDWGSLKFAYDWIDHPTPPSVFAGYGLGLLAKLLLRCAPQRLLSFMKKAADYGLALPVLAALGSACRWDEELATKALSSRVPFIIGLGLGQLLNNQDDGQGRSASAVEALLVESGVPLAGRIAASALMLKECVHAWYRQKDQAYEARRRREILRQAPQHATGGSRYADDEIRRLGAEIPLLEERRDAVCAKLDDALRTAARLDVSPKALWSTFEPSFVDTPEIRHRFAMEHEDGQTRRAALEASLEAFDALLGTKRPEKALSDSIDTIRGGGDIAYWAASSQVELSSIKGSNAGRDAALRIDRLEQCVRAYALQPFAAVRFGQHFQDALTRWSLLLQFAFRVCTSPSGGPFDKLREHALASARSFLPVASRSIYIREHVEAVIDLVVDAILASDKGVLSKWLEDEDMPVLLRASVAWSSPAVLRQKPDLARSLLEQSTRGTKRTLRGRNVSVLFALMDRAAAAAYRNSCPDIVAMLEMPYSLAISCPDVPLARSLDLQTLSAAVKGDEVAQRQVKDNPVWNQSRTAIALATASKPLAGG